MYATSCQQHESREEYFRSWLETRLYVNLEMASRAVQEPYGGFYVRRSHRRGGESRNPAHLQHIDRCRGEGVKKICERHIHTKCVNSWVSRFGKHFLWKFHRPVGRCFSCCEARQERKCNGNLHKNLLPNLETKLLTRSVWV